MDKYRNLHKWMIIPMVLMQLGIFMDYWGDFTDNAWSIHIHYWAGSIWYLFLVFQPYYATHGKMSIHRTNGIIGIFVAGGVGIGSLNMMYRDIKLVQISQANPGRFGPFNDWFFYGIAVVEMVMISAFMYAVIKSITQRKDLENHVWWLISTVFIIMLPALGRGIQFVQIVIEGFSPDLNVMTAIYLASFVIIVLTILTAIKYDKLRHPATFLVIAVNLFNCFLEPMGKSRAIQSVLETAIKG